MSHVEHVCCYTLVVSHDISCNNYAILAVVYEPASHQVTRFVNVQLVTPNHDRLELCNVDRLLLSFRGTDDWIDQTLYNHL